ncbi:YcjX family protein [Colwellia sp. 1_MG-2023]|uniref:YcjX family protein n=1 Tax=unclassified Colwellia TaxID=196834 RepID=UPI001C08CF04|nr:MULTISPECIES: YcjX family protein [unclassified Colwellia]MBU2925224.1 YcjX family protein [Colwellia sp. C2M11]MDO6651251.1 YcjX family protein [Colwellia sp. 3_MG-2023]MDO6664326.1 YcjX family protein [Colwellia sp. 2_MG-2023]MDO6688560.1 YcjX family protein [Colwellia sp. 1_MG-2023]
MRRSFIKRLDKLKNKAGEILNRTFDQHINLAVTGLSRSGKTAFITSLVNQLITEGNSSKLSFFDPVHNGNFIAAKRVPQKNLSIPRFDYDKAIASLTNEHPTWPEPTHGISELRLAIRYQPQKSLLKYAADMATLTLDITDYPGEWLLDLPMLKQTYEQWSEQTHALLTASPRLEFSQGFLTKVASIDPFDEADEELLAQLSKEYTDLLHAFRYQLGLSVIQPGRFILPAELAGAPILEFFPFPNLTNIDGNDYQNASDNSFIGMLRARFIEYKEEVVKKFYRQHFLRFDRQIVLADCLTPLNSCSNNGGAEGFADLQLAIDMILESYSYGKSGLFSRLFSPKIDKLLFAATKADHVTGEQHAPMVSLFNELIFQSKHNLNFEAIEMKTLAIASVKSTTSGKSFHKGQQVSVIQGYTDHSSTNQSSLNDEITLKTREKITLFPGSVPEHLPKKEFWQACAFNFINFLPMNGLKKNQPLPHIRMDQVLQFLLADKMI